MRLTSIETTPNPNSMKLNLEEQLGAAVTYTAARQAGCPEFVRQFLEIDGVDSVFVCGDFITLNKAPRAEWQLILQSAKALLSGQSQGGATSESQRQAAESDGQVHVLVQTFRGIPMQVKIVDSHGETRAALSARFNEAAQSIQAETGADFLTERYWADYGRRYGERADVAKELTEELEGRFYPDALERAKKQALGKGELPAIPLATLKEWLQHEDWQRRLTAVQELSHGTGFASLLFDSLHDPHPQVRRLTAAALGASGEVSAVQPLCAVLLSDSAPGVRRTAGDALSDIGDVSAQPDICRALSDTNKLVRWRAARFLSDLGTDEALPFLEKAAEDPEFEVRLEVKAAMDRIAGGAQGIGPAWKRIVEQA